MEKQLTTIAHLVLKLHQHLIFYKPIHYHTKANKMIKKGLIKLMIWVIVIEVLKQVQI